VTVTLPEDVLDRLSAVNADLGRAIVTVAERERPARRRQPARHAEIAAYGRHAVILVTPLKVLKRLPGVELVPVGNGRCLISLDRTSSISQLELAIRDALDRVDGHGIERDVLLAIAALLRKARVNRGLALEERTIIVLDSRPARAASRTRQ
jgi:hypothetical protein